MSCLLLEAELPLDLELDREAVAVPAGLARHVVPAHRLVAREHVLEDAREHVVRARAAVRRGRALVEDERVGALAAADRLVEDVALAPALEHPLLELGERLGRVDGVVASHARSILRAPGPLPPGEDIPPHPVLNLSRESPNRRRIGPEANGGPM